MTSGTRSRSGIRLLWANRPGEILTDEIVPCFPSLESAEYALSRSEVDFLMVGLSPFYAKIIDSLAGSISAINTIDRESCRVILRESVVLVTYALIDRIIRLCKVIPKNSSQALGVAVSAGASLPETNSHLMGLTDGSQEFNQYLIFRLASSIWNLDAVEANRPMLSDVRNSKPIANLNFDSPSLVVRIKRKISRMLSARLGGIPALRLANIESDLLDTGLFGVGKLMWLKSLAPEKTLHKDSSLRNLARSQLAAEVGTMLSTDVFVSQAGMDEAKAKRAAEVFCELLLELIPVDKLEGIPNFSAHDKHLESLSAPALFFCGMPGGADIYWIAAARKRRIPVIGIQHGAHYGFVNQPCFVETELAYCDYFISWGWDKFPRHPLCDGIQAITLPSPWLSGRAKAWKDVSPLGSGERARRPHDVLLMSDRIQSFPPTVNTLRMSRLDFLGKINLATAGIVSELAMRQIRVLNKPFNYTSRDMQATVLNKLTAQYADYYREHERLDKGLTADLLRSAWVVVWDEPGTGFFECLAGGIPSMVYWERLTSREEDYARPYFERLEAVGLLHTSPQSLAEAIRRFLSAPEEWLSDTGRSKVIQEVGERFAKTDDLWSKPWKAVLKALKSGAARPRAVTLE